MEVAPQLNLKLNLRRNEPLHRSATKIFKLRRFNQMSSCQSSESPQFYHLQVRRLYQRPQKEPQLLYNVAILQYLAAVSHRYHTPITRYSNSIARVLPGYRSGWEHSQTPGGLQEPGGLARQATMPHQQKQLSCTADKKCS